MVNLNAMKSRRLLTCAVVLLSIVTIAGAASAPTPPTTPTVAQLNLLDGRKLKNVSVKSFDRASGKLLVIANGKAMTIPLSTIPAALHAQLTENVPASGETVSTFTSPQPLPTAADQYHLTEQVPVSRVDAIAQPTTPAPSVTNQPQPAPKRQKQPTSNQLLAVQAGTNLNAHKAAALKRAQSYYRFEYRVGSDSATVTALDLDLTTPTPVPGWEGRYRTEGKAQLEFYDSRGRSFQRRSSSFEVTTEKLVGSDDLVVIDFIPKS
jgi:hypothetical protein